MFVVGAPRSGTTYLQNLLGAHSLIATSQETDLFTHYLSTWLAQWQQHMPEDPQQWLAQRHKGLPAVLTAADFNSLMRDCVERVQRSTLALKPGARVFLDKNPQNVFYGQLILQLLPTARFVHIVRDGRDVVVSQVRASRAWGRGWAPTSALIAAKLWRDHVVAARTIRRLTPAYVEVRYEDLLSDLGPALLSDTLGFCGVHATREDCEEIHRRFALDQSKQPPSSVLWGGEVRRRLGSAPPEPAGFSGEGGPGAWRVELTEFDRVAIERVVEPLLRELGYANSSDWTGAPWLRKRAIHARLTARALSDLGRTRLAQRLEP